MKPSHTGEFLVCERCSRFMLSGVTLLSKLESAHFNKRTFDSFERVTEKHFQRSAASTSVMVRFRLLH